MPTYRAASQAATGAASFSCLKPTGVVAEDILVAIHVTNSGSSAGMGAPTGGATWNPLTSRADGADSGGTKVWWKRAGAAEPGSYGFTQPVSSWPGAVSIVAVQAALTDIPIVAQNGSDYGSSNVPTPSTTPNGASDVEIRCAVAPFPTVEMSWTPPAGFTERTDIQSGIGSSMSTATRTLSSSGATGIFNFIASTTLYWRQGFTINIGTPIPRVFWGARITF